MSGLLGRVRLCRGVRAQPQGHTRTRTFRGVAAHPVLKESSVSDLPVQPQARFGKLWSSPGPLSPVLPGLRYRLSPVCSQPPPRCCPVTVSELVSGSCVRFPCGGGDGRGVLAKDGLVPRGTSRSAQRGRKASSFSGVPTSEKRGRGSGGKGKAAPGSPASVSHWLVPSGQSS